VSTPENSRITDSMNLQGFSIYLQNHRF
jgi:hypothetical protein